MTTNRHPERSEGSGFFNKGLRHLYYSKEVCVTENDYMTKVKRLVLSSLQGEKVKIIMFGSRARQDNHATSDVDIGIIPQGKMSSRKITLLRERIEQLNVPYKVEIVNFAEVSEDFKKEALKEVIVWKD